MQATLPFKEDADGQLARTKRIAQQRMEYDYDYEYVPGHAIHKKLPFKEVFSVAYIAELLSKVAPILPNSLATTARQFLDPLDELQDYDDFFNVIKIPAVAAVWQHDDVFAEQRLSGVNPMVLRALKPDDPRAAVVRGVKGADADLANNNIYVADYTGTDPAYRGPSFVKGGEYEKGKKYFPKPLAFFRWDKALGKLMPVAIQLLASKDGAAVYTPTGARVYTPSNSLDWLFAKLCVQCADGNHHELSTHLRRTHLVMDPIAVGTARNLDVYHPLAVLLRVHFRFNLSIDSIAKSTLLAQGGAVDSILAGTLPESFLVTAEACRTWDIKKFAFPQDIADRGLSDKARLPHHPYRDDGMLVWNAVYKYVGEYLRHFYKDDAAVVADAELQAWARELADQTSGGKVKGMPDKFSTVDELIPIVACIVFTSGPQHSAVNFSQDDYYGYVPNMPLALYNAEPLTRLPESSPITMAQILQVLPPTEKTSTQLTTAIQLATHQWDVLGFYEKSLKELYESNGTLEGIFGASDPVVGIIKNFQRELSAVEAKIDERNKKRKVTPYIFMKPSQIANSISI